MDKVGGIVEVKRTNDTHEIVISPTVLKAEARESFLITLSPRHARHLANVLIEHATHAEAEASGTYAQCRPYRRKDRIQE